MNVLWDHGPLQDKVGPDVKLTQFALSQFSNAHGVSRRVLFGWEKAER
jgi:hypothetical protein